MVKSTQISKIIYVINNYEFYLCNMFLLINLYICNYFSKPLTIKVNKPRGSLGQKTIFEVLQQSLDDTNNRTKDQATIRKLRDSASQSIKVNKYLIIYI